MRFPHWLWIIFSYGLFTDISQKTPIVQFFSPASWIGISNIGYEYNWDCPTMGYIIFVLCVLIGVLSVMSLLKIKKKGIY